jgi:hypothetical protein
VSIMPQSRPKSFARVRSLSETQLRYGTCVIANKIANPQLCACIALPAWPMTAVRPVAVKDDRPGMANEVIATLKLRSEEVGIPWQSNASRAVSQRLWNIENKIPQFLIRVCNSLHEECVAVKSGF